MKLMIDRHSGCVMRWHVGGSYFHGTINILGTRMIHGCEWWNQLYYVNWLIALSIWFAGIMYKRIAKKSWAIDYAQYDLKRLQASDFPCFLKPGYPEKSRNMNRKSKGRNADERAALVDSQRDNIPCVSLTRSTRRMWHQRRQARNQWPRSASAGSCQQPSSASRPAPPRECR